MTRHMTGGPDPRAVFPPRPYSVTYRPASALRTNPVLVISRKPSMLCYFAKSGRGRLEHKVTLSDIAASESDAGWRAFHGPSLGSDGG